MLDHPTGILIATIGAVWLLAVVARPIHDAAGRYIDRMVAAWDATRTTVDQHADQAMRIGNAPREYAELMGESS